MRALIHRLTGERPWDEAPVVGWLDVVTIACGDPQAQMATWRREEVTCERCLTPPPPRKGRGTSMPEKVLQDTMRQACLSRGWLYFHLWGPHSQRSTPGFPDICAVRDHRLLFAELKRLGQGPTSEQSRWLEALGRVTSVEVYLWTPDDLPIALEVLR